MTTGAHDRLAAYLNDHLAGSIIAREIAEHRRKEPKEEAVAVFLDRFLQEIEEDRRALRRAMDAAGVDSQVWKELAAVGASWLGRLRPRLENSSPELLRDIEMLLLGVRGKLLVWTTLFRLPSPLLPKAELSSLMERARRQLDELEGLHERVVDLQLASST